MITVGETVTTVKQKILFSICEEFFNDSRKTYSF